MQNDKDVGSLEKGEKNVMTPHMKALLEKARKGDAEAALEVLAELQKPASERK